ncbi:MAG: PcfJ domain-containing protein, partial [Methylococcaceae bacterium]
VPEKESGVIGLISGVGGIPAIFGTGGLPERLSQSYDRNLRAQLAAEGLPTTGDMSGPLRFAVAAGEVLGQAPVPGKLVAKTVEGVKSAAGKAASLAAEYFTPWINPRVGNYAAGTLIGGSLRQLEEPSWQSAPEMQEYLVQESAAADERNVKRAWLEKMVADAEGKERDRLYNKYFKDADFSMVKGYARGGLRARSADVLPKQLQGTQIVKEPGGNWLSGGDSLGSYVDSFKQHRNEPGADPMNTWLGKKLHKYMSSDMGTKGDPIRLGVEKWETTTRPALVAKQQARIDKVRADQEAYLRDNPGAPPHALVASQEQVRDLEAAMGLLHGKTGLHFEPGFAPEYPGVRSVEGKTSLSRDWEAASDSAIRSKPASYYLDAPTFDFSNPHIYTDPWLVKVPPETPVHRLRSDVVDLQFEHMVDELRNALNPDSGLPADLLITPRQLETMPIEGAVEHVSSINAWRGAQKAVADKRRALNEATRIHKEYSDDPKGMRWVELQLPEPVIPEGYALGPVSGYPNLVGVIDQVTGRSVSLGATPEEALRVYKRKERAGVLEDALKYEGEQLAHCVGGGEYCPKVLSGESRIFSLRDTEGKPYATVETKPSGDPVEDAYGKLPKQEREEIRATAGVYPADRRFVSQTTQAEEASKIKEVMLKLYPELVNMEPQYSIAQIKGRLNRRPAEEAMPYINDFVRSSKWGGVEDLAHTGLLDAKKLRQGFSLGLPQSDYQRIVDAGLNEKRDLLNDLDYATADEIVERLQGAPGFAKGGLVNDDEYNPSAIDAIINRLHLNGQLSSFKDEYVSGVQGGGNIAVDITPNTTLGANVYGFNVKTPEGVFKDVDLSGMSLEHRSGPHRIKARKSSKGKDWGLEYEYSFANGGLVDSGYNAGQVDSLANQLMEEVYGQ